MVFNRGIWRILFRRALPILLLSLILSIGRWQASAQEVTETPPTDTPNTEVPRDPPVIHSEPKQIVAGQEGVLSIFGTGTHFVTGTTVRLVGFGFLTVTVLNDTSLTAVLPANIPASGKAYTIEVTSPVDGAVDSQDTLKVVAPTATPAPVTPQIIPTVELPTPLPGQPSLVVRNFVAKPATTLPGGTVVLNFEVVNQGNRVAEGVSVSVDPGGKFVPANGAASATLPDLGPGTSFNVTLTVVAASDTPAGANIIPVTMAYRDFSGTAYSSKATLSVNVLAISEASQITLARYLVDPNPVQPGERVEITVLITNTGNETAAQVLLRVAGDGSVLLAGPEGDSFPLGDLKPGASASVKLPLVVSAAAKSGPQSQPIVLTFLQKGQAQTVNSSMTIEVAKVSVPAPVMLLESYETGKEVLRPGDQFTLTMTLKNVGAADAENLLVTFGTVDSAPTGDSGTGGNGGTGDNGSSTSTNPSSTFAPLGSGGTLFVGNIAAGESGKTITQDFIVNGGVKSGIYALPITLRYQKPDGTTAQDNLRASLVVVVLPALQATLNSPIPPGVNVGDTIPLSLKIANVGTDPINLVSVTTTADNGTVLDGAELPLTPLKGGEDTSVNPIVSADAEGTVTLTVTIHYLDDLNRPATMEFTYTTEASAPPTPDTSQPPPDFTAQPTEEPQDNNLLGRILLGLLGLGS